MRATSQFGGFGLSALLMLLLVVAPPSRAVDYPVAYSKISRTSPAPEPRASHAPFSAAAEVVNGHDTGLIGDGRTDNTSVFKRIFSSPGRKVTIPAGDYLTGRFEVPSDTTIILASGVTIRDNGHLGPNDPLVRIVGNHVQILGGGDSTIRADRATYTTGEQRHGVFIYGVSDVTIRDIRSIGHGGDGFYIGGPPRHPATDITIRACKADNNRRQGLSITNARRIDIVKSDFSGTNGTLPEAGIDLEPNAPEDFLDGITFISVRTSNNRGGGLLVYPGKLNSNSTPIDITIIDHQSVGEKPTFQSRGSPTIPGVVRYIQFE